MFLLEIMFILANFIEGHLVPFYAKFVSILSNGFTKKMFKISYKAKLRKTGHTPGGHGFSTDQTFLAVFVEGLRFSYF